MSENLKLFFKALKKHIPLLTIICIMTFSCFFVRFSSQDAFATEQIACVKLSTAIFEKNNLDIQKSENFYLSSSDSRVKNIDKDCFTLNANSSLYYIFEISNLSINPIECELKYTKENVENFIVTYSFDTDESALSSTNFLIGANEVKLLYVHIFIEDLSLDANIDGSMSLTVCSIKIGA